MDPELRFKREKRRVETKEDINHFLEEIQDFDLEEIFYKIFSRQASKDIQDSMNLSKEELNDLAWGEEIAMFLNQNQAKQTRLAA